MQGPHSRLLYLDTIRGIAALSVVFSHFAERTPLHKLALFDFFTPGQFGVVIFFILSGYVIPFSFKRGLRDFAISRFFRLYPAYWVSVALAVICSVAFLDIKPGLSTVAANLTMVQKLLGFPDLFGVYWTLLVELAFYVLCAGLFVTGALNSVKIRFVFSVLLLFSSLAAAAINKTYGIPAPVGLQAFLSMMLFGSLWRDFTLAKNPLAGRLSAIWILLFCAVFPIIALLAYNVDKGLGESAKNFTGSFIGGLLFFLVFTTLIKLQARWMSYLGTISYSIYLVHPFFLNWIASAMNMATAFNVPVFILYVAAVIAAASLSYFLVEKPSITLGRRLKTRPLSGGVVAPAPHRH
jgi:peptidoglycan/LPS O-acetylase OafA/YrhL